MLNHRLIAGVLGLVVLVAAACAPRISSTDFTAGASGASADAASWRFAGAEVVVDPDMPVHTDEGIRYPSENRLVWWGDPPGDRKAQVETLMEDAVQAGALDALSGGRDVKVKLFIQQFHAMTPRARATNIQLGVHEIKFDISVVDAATGEVLASEQGVNSDLRAFSGSEAVLAEQAGQGQKIRIQTRVAQVVRAWLTS